MTGAAEITRALRGRWYGRYGLAFCPAHGNWRTPALRLADGAGGRLLAFCSAGCEFRDVIAALRDRGLAGGGVAPIPDPVREAAALHAARAEREAGTRRARNLWAEGLPAAGTLVEAYLRARAIRAGIPPTLRFAANAWHPSARRLPAMLTAVERVGEAGMVSLHRTYLAEPGRKAEIERPKAMLGPVAGGAARLSDGPGPLVVAEGIETALTVLDDLAGLRPRVWAGLSASGVAGLRLPRDAGELVVAPDAEPAGRAAAQALADRADALGWRVRVLPPPEDASDWNDVAQAEREAGR
ncbi:MAG: toprim domain-containing protein [Pseudomonadota bacterium]|nr:toprim domain-containing protein [Pseudomonadota bacterium]MEE3100990.1 toprim domain-containing protein [Pseudomonadota bacterium]